MSIKQTIGPFLHQRVLIIYPLGVKNRHDVKNNNELIFSEEQNQVLHFKEDGRSWLRENGL